jgi:hypothetical protein
MFRRLLLLAAPLAVASIAWSFAGCTGGRTELDIEVPDAGSDAEPVIDAGPPPPIEKSTKVDLLFVVDNSPNTDAAHDLLADTAPYLLDRLAHPACVNGLGNVVSTTPSPSDPCPVGEREFAPLTDVHVAVISTSLGGHGADTCSPASPSFDPQQNDAAHLLSRGPGNTVVPTYADKGFLAWDPAQKASPPGDSDLGALSAKLQQILHGTGEKGCGFESQLESIYRFLVDPEPYQSVQVSNGKAQPTGVDPVVLQQRADFLRPDSAVVVVLVTDENDCSTREGSQYFISNQGGDPNGSGKPFHMPRARVECAVNPADPCCASCAQATPAGCPPTENDPNCQLGSYDIKGDPINLRCFDQKRRFGIDFLYPVERYVDALTKTDVTTREGEIVPNPLFAGNRSPKLVMLAGIVGVPWQDIAKNPKALSDGYAPATEINWPLLLSDPTSGAPPADPLMIESIAPRMGQNPVTGDALAPPTSGPLANAINGHERIIPNGDDLQNACIYARPTPKDCTNDASCFCTGADIDTNPICQASDGSYSNVERFARALPATRELRVLQGLGAQATVASICAAVTTGNGPTVAYKPAADAILRTLRPRVN